MKKKKIVTKRARKVQRRLISPRSVNNLKLLERKLKLERLIKRRKTKKKKKKRKKKILKKRKVTKKKMTMMIKMTRSKRDRVKIRNRRKSLARKWTQ